MENCSKTLKKTNPYHIPHKIYPQPENKINRKTENSDKPHRKTKPSIDCRRKDHFVTPNSLPSPSPSPSPLPAPLPVIKMYGSPNTPATSYIRFAFLHKPVTLLFTPSETPDFGFSTPVIQFGYDVISGSPVIILRYLDAKFSKPLLLGNWSASCNETMPPAVVTVALLHHKSLLSIPLPLYSFPKC